MICDVQDKKAQALGKAASLREDVEVCKQKAQKLLALDSARMSELNARQDKLQDQVSQIEARLVTLMRDRLVSYGGARACDLT
jgi:hypothetical protein